MKTRAIITTVVSFLLLVAVLAAGLNAVFTVTLVESEFSVFSEEGRADAERLKSELDGFVGSSTTFLDLDDVKNTVEKYPCFRVEALEKKFPKTVEVKVSERKEFYAIRQDDGYAVLDEEGIFLYEGENRNRLGGVNVVLEGFDTTLEKGERVQGRYIDCVFEMISAFSGLLPGLRANVVSVRLAHSGSNAPENDYFVITMREGVKIAIANPSADIAVKARAAFLDDEFGYLSPALSDSRRVYGTINVIGNSENGSVNVSFWPDLPI